MYLSNDKTPEGITILKDYNECNHPLELVLSYKGHKIEIRYDQDTCNPFEDWDCEPPALVRTGRHSYFTEYSSERINCVPDLTDEQIKNNIGDLISPLNSEWNDNYYILRMLENCAKDCMTEEQREALTSLIKEMDVGRGAFHLADAKTDKPLFDSIVEDLNTLYEKARTFWTQAEIEPIVLELLREGLHNYLEYGVRDSERLGYLSSLYTIAEMPNVCAMSTGYSRGDWAGVLIVWTPEFIQRTGIDLATMTTEDVETSIEETCKLYGYWAWGDVSYFVVYDPEGEVVDTCGGFFGDCPVDSGLLEAAMDCITYNRTLRAEEAREVAYWECRDVVTV